MHQQLRGYKYEDKLYLGVREQKRLNTTALVHQEVKAPRISRQSAHEGGKVVSPRHRPPLPPKRYPWYSFLLEAKSTPGP
jgi:hypothetical protein